MMPGGARDPYERMLDDALVSMSRVHDTVQGVALKINTGESERAVLFRHVDELRAKLDALDRAIRGNGDTGLRGRVEALEADRGGERWKAMAQIAVAFVAAMSLYLQLTGG